MAERPRMSANVLIALSTWLPDDLTAGQLDRVLSATAEAADTAYREGYSSAVAERAVTQLAVRESHDSQTGVQS